MEAELREVVAKIKGSFNDIGAVQDLSKNRAKVTKKTTSGKYFTPAKQRNSNSRTHSSQLAIQNTSWTLVNVLTKYTAKWCKRQFFGELQLLAYAEVWRIPV